MKKLLYILLVIIPACLIGITSYAHCPQALKYGITCRTDTGAKITIPISVETIYNKAGPECRVNDKKVMTNGQIDSDKLVGWCSTVLQSTSLTKVSAISGVDCCWHGGLLYTKCFMKDDLGSWFSYSPKFGHC